jgi:hypothetical protein
VAESTGSVPTGCVFYAVNGCLAGVLGITGCIAYCSLCLVYLAFGFEFLVARDMPGNFLSLTSDVICCTFHMFLVHVLYGTWMLVDEQRATAWSDKFTVIRWFPA